MGQSPAMQCDCPAAFFLLGIEHNERVCLWHHWLGPLASGDAPALAEQAEERVMLSNEHNEQMCFVCYRVADMPAPRVPSVRRPCAGCDVPIWVPTKSPTAPPKICIRCTGPDGSVPSA